MSPVYKLAAADWRNIRQDPTLAAMIAAPILLWLVLRYGIPPLAEYVNRFFAFELLPYFDLMVVSFAVLSPLTLGMLIGFLMLDDRDEQMIAYYAVTPLAKRGYLIYRLLFPSLLGIASNVPIVFFSGLVGGGGDFESVLRLFFLLVTSLQTPMIALFVSAYAADKVEGLAFAKVSGLLIFGPVAACFLPGGWSAAAAWLPSFWPADAWLNSDAPLKSGIGITVGGLYHLLILYVLTRQFLRKNE